MHLENKDLDIMEKKARCKECDGKDAGFQFKALIDNNAPGASLRIIKDGKTVWQKDRPSKPMVVSNVRAVLSEDSHVDISWRCDTAMDVWIRWSNNGGVTWNALTVGLKGKSAKLNVDHLPSGEITFQVLANDGFSTATGSSNTVELPSKPPVVSILYPHEKDPIYRDKYLHLRGTATDLTGLFIPDDSFVWYLEKNEVGRGRDIWVLTPDTGNTLTLKVTNAQGTEGNAQSVITVRNPD